MLAFIRTKRVGEREYRQIVENYREDGRHRQRVLAHLGQHETLEDAVEDLEEKLVAWDESKTVEQWREAEQAAQDWERSLRKRHGDIIDHYHDGEIPTESEVGECARMVSLYDAPRTEEVVGKTYWGEPIYAFREIEAPPEVEEYRRAFGGVEGVAEVTNMGTRFHYGGLFKFRHQVRCYHYWRGRAAEKHHAYEHRRQYLQGRLDKLRAVVTRTSTVVTATR